jgi:hypothetical protein
LALNVRTSENPLSKKFAERPTPEDAETIVEIIAAMDRADLDRVQRAIDERRAAFQQFSTAPSVMGRRRIRRPLLPPRDHNLRLSDLARTRQRAAPRQDPLGYALVLKDALGLKGSGGDWNMKPEAWTEGMRPVAPGLRVGRGLDPFH